MMSLLAMPRKSMYDDELMDY
ncbi:hypothetical protein F383_17597 [Gossypium arboreum]|uniref:Uncharacterized protein n=1 Tax=Gossypium arboreum TaxID=29729 RepID=A0A0B0MZ45_GOSAR|nr:hypothetical protein F383_13629 [Gossypium arboreum]KHG12265.1 hypothetical protein F383_17597 [Gossypium arboreum]